MKKIKKARIGTTSSSTTRKPVGMTMKELKMKYPTIDTNARGDVRGTEMNAYAPLRELQKYNDAYNAFERKFGNKPATDNTAMKKPVKKPIKKSKNGTSLGMKSVAGGVGGKSPKAPMVDPNGAYTKVQERTLGNMKKGGKIKKIKKAASGASLKPVNAAKNPGLSKLPTAVRNKMGYQKMGGKTKKK